jgi:sigma-B regulation protein RsbU (phosphoserine phosphatase)
MGRLLGSRRLLLTALATLFAAASVLYASVWIYDVRHPSVQVELGFDNKPYDEIAQAIGVRAVAPGAPAEKAGLQAGDRIIAVNGRALTTVAPFEDAWAHGRPGDSVELTVERPGQPKPLVLHGVFRVRSFLAQEGLVKASAIEVTKWYPVVFLAVGLAVLFLRLDDPHAWLLAFLFGGFIAVGDSPYLMNLPAALRGFSCAYQAIFCSLIAALFYFFFAIFPTHSFVDRRLPWLKWAGLGWGICLALPGLTVGYPRLPSALTRHFGSSVTTVLTDGYFYSFFLLGLVALAGNVVQAGSREARKKLRVILGGTVVGVLPIVIVHAVQDIAGYHSSFWRDIILILFLFLFPLSFAYAVVKHRVLEIPVLLKLSARYVLVRRGYLVFLFLVAATAIALFTHFFSRFFRTDTPVGMVASGVFGIVLMWASAPVVKRGTEHIDRAFFRSSYDARVILHDLAEKIRTVTDRHRLAALIDAHIEGALHPKTMACYLEAGDSQLVAECGAVPPALSRVSALLPILSELKEDGRSRTLDGAAASSVFAPLKPECLVPILGRDSRLIGLLVLGQRLSEEPYSSEDRHLLDSVANQAGMALESIRLAEKMAEKMEEERRAAHEMEIAREVQARLFPQRLPQLKTLDYIGGCVQAHEVGGDYYDFLDLGAGKLGMVLADISGKGISGALLMANLQANLRSHYARALEDLPGLLCSVNHLFFQNSPDHCYATLFFGIYDDETRTLRYANCGHLPPLLLHGDGGLDRLCATATVLGLFDDWTCVVKEVALHAGDMLTVYTDGVTEAANGAEEEFGEARLIEAIHWHPQLDPNAQFANIQAAVQGFSNGARADDLTMVIARTH